MAARNNIVGLVICSAVILGAPLLGAGIGLGASWFSDGNGWGDDPAQKSRVLAERISSAMAGAFAGSLVSCVAAVPALVFVIRLLAGKTREEAT